MKTFIRIAAETACEKLAVKPALVFEGRSFQVTNISSQEDADQFLSVFLNSFTSLLSAAKTKNETR